LHEQRRDALVQDPLGQLLRWATAGQEPAPAEMRRLGMTLMLWLLGLLSPSDVQ
jgi:hypothetical protein